MKRLLAALLLVASPVLGQATNGWAEMANGWGEIQTATGGSSVPTGCVATSVPIFLGSPVAMGCDAGLTYDAGTGALRVGAAGIVRNSIDTFSAGYTAASGDYGLHLANFASLTWAAGAGASSVVDLVLSRAAAATLQLGAAAANADGVDQTIQTQGGITGTDRAAGDLTIQTGVGTGTGASKIVFRTPTRVGTGTTAQTNAARMTISDIGVNLQGLPVFADNTAAAALATGDLYQTSTGVLMIKY